MPRTLSVRRAGPDGPSAATTPTMWAQADDDGPVGYAWCDDDGALHLLLDEAVGTADRPALAAALVGALRDDGGATPRRWFARDTRPADEAVAAALGLQPTRELWQMRRPLPLRAPDPASTAPLDWRPFEPGRDEAAWLQVNNRAFARHPDQGHQTLDHLLTLHRGHRRCPGGGQRWLTTPHPSSPVRSADPTR